VTTFLLDQILFAVLTLLWAIIVLLVLAGLGYRFGDERLTQPAHDALTGLRGRWRRARRPADADPAPAQQHLEVVQVPRTTDRMPDTDPLTCDGCNGTVFRRYEDRPELLVCTICSHCCNHEGGVNAPYFEAHTDVPLVRPVPDTEPVGQLAAPRDRRVDRAALLG
jgi:hypothetical protein